jgi:hypothetical protein
MWKAKNRMTDARSQTNIRKTAIELTEEQYYFPHKKALKLQKQIQNASIMSIIRDLSEKDCQELTGAK